MDELSTANDTTSSIFSGCFEDRAVAGDEDINTVQVTQLTVNYRTTFYEVRRHVSVDAHDSITECRRNDERTIIHRDIVVVVKDIVVFKLVTFCILKRNAVFEVNPVTVWVSVVAVSSSNNTSA